MFHKILFSGLILLMLGFGVLLHHFSEPADLLKKYQKLGLVQSDFTYEKVEKAWGDQGLIFYQVQFPFIPVPMQADTMSLSLQDSGMNMYLKKVRIQVTEGLKKLYGSEIADKLNTYVPYQDFLTRLLTSMAVMGIDEFVGDMALNTVYSDAKTMRFTVRMTQEKQSLLQMEGTIHIPIVGAHQLSDLWNGQVDSAGIKVEESLFKRYVNYAKSRQVTLPDFVQQGLIKIKGKTKALPSLKDVLK